MQFPTEQWYAAILRRHSRRQFNGKELPRDLLNNVLKISDELNNYVEGARVELVNKNSDQVFKGAAGSYGKIKGAPAYVAFIGSMKDPNVQEKVGYLGELFILDATSRGLATCWVGGFFRPEVAMTQVSINEDEQVLAVSPLGFADERVTLEERLMSGFASSHKRKNLEGLFLSLPKKPLTPWISSALNAARLAPSAVNRQPWRFSVENESIRISQDNSKASFHISKRLDCGIAMAHIEIAAQHEGVVGHWEYLVEPDVARFVTQGRL